MTKNLFIAGAGGYIGTRMTEYFLNKGHNVIAFDRYFFGDTLSDLSNHPNLKIIKGDIRCFDEKLLQGIDATIDLASISNDPSSELLPSITEEINFHGAVNIAKQAKRMGVKKHIFSSSCSIYGAGDNFLTETSLTDPISTYAKCKLLAEKEILALGDNSFCATSLRNSTVYGLSRRRMRFDLIINIMTLNAWKNGKIFILGGGNQWRPLIHIEDLIRAFEAVIEENDTKKLNREIFNVGTNDQNYQVKQVAYFFRDHFPNLQIELIPEDPDARDYKVNFDKIANTLGLQATKTIHDGIKEVKEALEKGLITDDLKTKTVGYYKFLTEADHVLSSIKLDGNLFTLNNLAR